MPITLGPRDEPWPDVVVVIGKPDDFDIEHPLPQQVALLVEVADTTLQRDRRVKLPRYAFAEVGEVWLVDLENRRLEIYREPSQDGYGLVIILAEDKTASPLFKPEAQITVSDLLPNRR